MKKISVITVNFNQSLVTEQLLASINVTNTYHLTEIIVVDNGSIEDPTPQWKENYAGIKFIRSDANLGFAGGNNLGVKEATGDYLFFVNNDTEFTPGLIKSLADVMDADNKVGIVSPKILYFDEPDTLQYAGFTPMNYYTCRNETIGKFERDIGQYDELLGPTGYAHGAAMMVRRKAINEAGLMAENFFLYYEEMDWCDHIKRSGYQVWFVPQAVIYHKESVSVGRASGLKEYFMNRNRILFIRRNAPTGARIFFYFYFALIVTPRNIINYLKNKQKGFAALLLKAVWWNVTHGINSNNLGYPVKRI